MMNDEEIQNTEETNVGKKRFQGLKQNQTVTLYYFIFLPSTENGHYNVVTA